MNRKDPVDFLATISIIDIVRAAWSRRTSVVICGIVLSILVGVFLMSLPNRYVSNAQLLVRLGPGAVAMDPTAGLSQTVSLQESRLTQVNSVAELLRSKEMIQRVAAKVGPKRLTERDSLIGKLTNWLPKRETQPEGGLSAEEIDRMMGIAEACVAIEDDLGVTPATNAYTINLEFTADSPFLAHDVVAAFLEAYPKYHSKAHEALGSVEFFESEAKSALERATEMQERVSALKAKHGIIELDSAKRALRDQMSQVQTELNAVDGDLSSVEAELGMLQREMQSMPDTIESETISGISKPSGDLVRGRFYDLELQAQELASKYKRDHPKRVALDAQLKAAREIARTEMGDQKQKRQVINPNVQSLDLAYRTASARRSGLQAKRLVLEEQTQRMRRQLLELNQVGAELTQLSWDASVAEKNYLETSDRLASARQISALGNQRMSDVAVAQPATLELKKVGPRRGFFGVAALVLIAAFSVLQAAIRGLLWPTDEERSHFYPETLTAKPRGQLESASPPVTVDQGSRNIALSSVWESPTSGNASAYFEALKKRPR